MKYIKIAGSHLFEFDKNEIPIRTSNISRIYTGDISTILIYHDEIIFYLKLPFGDIEDYVVRMRIDEMYESSIYKLKLKWVNEILRELNILATEYDGHNIILKLGYKTKRNPIPYIESLLKSWEL